MSIFSFLARTYKSFTLCSFDKSATIIVTFVGKCSCIFSNFSLFLDTSISSYPFVDKYLAISSPIPDDAPVIKAFILSPTYIYYTKYNMFFPQLTIL